MKIGFMGRSRMLLDTIKLIARDDNHVVAFVWTSKSEDYNNCTAKEFEEISNKIGCDYFFSTKVEEIEPLIEFDEVDLILSMNFVNIIPQSFLKKIKHGVINAHAGDLPRYKGNAVANWAIINNEKKIVLTMHKMTSELDSGPIYIQEEFKLNEKKDIGDVYSWMEKITPKLFFETISRIEKGKRPKKQSDNKAMRTFPRKLEDSKIDWTEGIENILRLIRASTRPFPGAFCFLNNNKDKRVNIFSGEKINLKYNFYAIDGQILEYGKDYFCVASKNKAIKVTDFSLNGLNKKDSLNEIVNSMRNRLT